ncbi:hypothetical protein A5641_13600 [Mycobacterium sp. 1554424.7]|nr:hypothetical protein A5641_13600 [Mycobacterium sp. 1554424.7]
MRERSYGDSDFVGPTNHRWKTAREICQRLVALGEMSNVTLVGEQVASVGCGEAFDSFSPLRAASHRVDDLRSTDRVGLVIRDDAPGADGGTHAGAVAGLLGIEDGSCLHDGDRKFLVCSGSDDSIGDTFGQLHRSRAKGAQPDLDIYRTVEGKALRVQHSGKLAIDDDGVAGQ